MLIVSGVCNNLCFIAFNADSTEDALQQRQLVLRDGECNEWHCAEFWKEKIDNYFATAMQAELKVLNFKVVA